MLNKESLLLQYVAPQLHPVLVHVIVYERLLVYLVPVVVRELEHVQKLLELLSEYYLPLEFATFFKYY